MPLGSRLTNDATPYRRGVILGLSIAEAFLIFIFVLLMIFSLVIVDFETKKKELLAVLNLATEQVSEANARAREARELLAQLGAPGGRKIPDDWDQIVRSVDAVDSLTRAGVDLKAAVDNPSAIVALQQRSREGYSPQLLEGILNAIPLFGNAAEIPKDWTELARTYADIKSLKEHGVDVGMLAANAKIARAIQDLIGKGYRPEQLLDMLAAVEQFGKPDDFPKNWDDVASGYDQMRALKDKHVDVTALLADSRLVEAIQQLRAKGYTQDQLSQLLAAVPQFGNPTDLPRDWRRVVDAYNLTAALERDRVDLRLLAENPNILITIQQLLAEGKTQEKILELLANFDRVAQADTNMGDLGRGGVDVSRLVSDPKLAAEIQRLMTTGYTKEQLQSLLAGIQAFGRPANLPSDWTRVAAAYKLTVDLERERVDLRLLAENPNILIAMQQLIAKGKTREKILELLANFDRVAQADTNMGDLGRGGIDVSRLVSDPKLAAEIQRLMAAGYTKEQLQSLFAGIQAFGRPADLPGDWNQVARAYAAMRLLQSNGISLWVLAEKPKTAAAIQQFLQKGYTPAQIAGALELLAKNGNNHPGPSPPAGQWPPMIPLSEADGYYFETNSAELRSDFVARLHQTIVPKILEIMKVYGVNVIEVTGNTDERPLTRASTNMDKVVLDVLRGDLEVGEMLPADNAGLGLARAIAVAKELMSDDRLAGKIVVPLSAAQLIDLSGRLTDGTHGGDVQKRRRIEIRLRQVDQRY
jgi:SOS response regulatory protein OraA/RecX